MNGFKRFYKRILGKMILVYLSVNILFALLISRRVYSFSQFIEMREWDAKLMSLIRFIMLFIKHLIENFG